MRVSFHNLRGILIYINEFHCAVCPTCSKNDYNLTDFREKPDMRLKLPPSISAERVEGNAHGLDLDVTQVSWSEVIIKKSECNSVQGWVVILIVLSKGLSEWKR
jgi:hypothetical protein